MGGGSLFLNVLKKFNAFVYSEEKPDPKAERKKPEKITMTESYKSFEESLGRNWSDLRPKALKKISPVAFLTHRKFILYLLCSHILSKYLFYFFSFT